MRRLVVPQAPVRNHQLTLVGKTIKRDTQNSLGFSDVSRSPNLGQTTRPNNSQSKRKRKKKKKKRENISNCEICIPAEHRVKLKETEKKYKYFDLARGLKKLWNMKVTEIPIVIGNRGTVTKGLEQGLEDLEIRRRVETIQTTGLLRSARILRRVQETRRDLLSLKLRSYHRLTLM